MFNNVKEPPNNISGKTLKPGDIVYHWQQPEVHYQIIGEPRWGKDGGDLIILDNIAICKPLAEELEVRRYSTFDLIKID